MAPPPLEAWQLRNVELDMLAEAARTAPPSGAPLAKQLSNKQSLMATVIAQTPPPEQNRKVQLNMVTSALLTTPQAALQNRKLVLEVRSEISAKIAPPLRTVWQF